MSYLIGQNLMPCFLKEMCQCACSILSCPICIFCPIDMTVLASFLVPLLAVQYNMYIEICLKHFFFFMEIFSVKRLRNSYEDSFLANRATEL